MKFHPTPKRPPFTYTFRFVHVGWGHRHNHPCQVSFQSVHQFRLPRGSKITISHRLGEWLLQQCYALTCYTVMDVAHSNNNNNCSSSVRSNKRTVSADSCNDCRTHTCRGTKISRWETGASGRMPREMGVWRGVPSPHERGSAASQKFFEKFC